MSGSLETTLPPDERITSPDDFLERRVLDRVFHRRTAGLRPCDAEARHPIHARCERIGFHDHRKLVSPRLDRGALHESAIRNASRACSSAARSAMCKPCGPASSCPRRKRSKPPSAVSCSANKSTSRLRRRVATYVSKIGPMRCPSAGSGSFAYCVISSYGFPAAKNDAASADRRNAGRRETHDGSEAVEQRVRTRAAQCRHEPQPRITKPRRNARNARCDQAAVYHHVAGKDECVCALSRVRRQPARESFGIARRQIVADQCARGFDNRDSGNPAQHHRQLSSHRTIVDRNDYDRSSRLRRRDAKAEQKRYECAKRDDPHPWMIRGRCGNRCWSFSYR